MMERPAEFLQEEERCGYTVSADMKKVWAVELDLLEQLKAVCERHGLTYYAGGGTMTENIDAAGGKGTGAFALEAIKIYCK